MTRPSRVTLRSRPHRGAPTHMGDRSQKTPLPRHLAPRAPLAAPHPLVPDLGSPPLRPPPVLPHGPRASTSQHRQVLPRLVPPGFASRIQRSCSAPTNLSGRRLKRSMDASTPPTFQAAEVTRRYPWYQM
ncbi:hypothetical protein NDU88_005208 [Pleurodeles waltl]|uniref:Uncharacterized protein n=1 Tax=Pleurodeles waltl TaxID=8319 RepID=A0AAV7LM76_PLEWA|nr:hypothetical protein NDU88_005208 [Pleurodeles waltl]